MDFRRFIYVLGAAVVPPFAHADVFSIEPVSPRFQEDIRLHVNLNVSMYVLPTKVSMVGNTIIVALTLPGAMFPEPPPGEPFDVPLGRFPAGHYDVNVVSQTESQPPSPLANLHFDVPDQVSFNDVPAIDFTDLWWNPSESGWGLSIVEHPSKNLFAAWYVYGADGKPTWYVLPGGTWSGQVFSGSIYKTTGPYFAQAFDPATVHASSAGTASLRFDGVGNSGTLSYTIDGVTGSKAIQREPF